MPMIGKSRVPIGLVAPYPFKTRSVLMKLELGLCKHDWSSLTQWALALDTVSRCAGATPGWRSSTLPWNLPSVLLPFRAVAPVPSIGSSVAMQTRGGRAAPSAGSSWSCQRLRSRGPSISSNIQVSIVRPQMLWQLF